MEPFHFFFFLFFFSRIIDIVVACDRDSAGIISSGKPQYHHVGEVVDGIDMRAEVALLSRNILIYGEMEKSCYGKMCQFYSHDTFGGHVKVCTASNVSVAPRVTCSLTFSTGFHLPVIVSLSH